MEEAKSLYKLRIEDKDNIIKQQNKIIKTLIYVILTIFIVCSASLVIGWCVYLEAPVVESTNFTGDSNTNISDNTLDSTDMNVR